MTQRIYYNEPYRRSFEATVAGVERRDGGALVVLDRTAFYPTSGGQPFDTGTLGGFPVVDVIDQEDGTIGHVVTLEPGTVNLVPGSAISGEIDWARRFDHMQQHTGQHVLSAAFDRLFKVATVSFHLGAEASTIDLARTVTAAEMTAAENEANRIVWDDRPVQIRYATADEAAALKLRKPSAREGTLRLIDVQDFDLSACGGTHVARTGAIGTIAVASSEKFKGGQRVEFVCGGRALERFRLLRDAVAASARLLSVMPGELPTTIERLQAEAKEQQRSIAGLHSDLARYRAAEIGARAETVGSVRVVAQVIEGDANVLKMLASTIVEQTSHIAVFASTSRPSLVVVARSADISTQADDLLKALIGRFGGRGGGRGDFAQGGLNAAGDEIVAAARASIMAEHGTAS